MMRQARAATRTEGKPSMRKSRRQGAMGLYSASLTISQAREAAKEVARGAAMSCKYPGSVVGRECLRGHT
jgi:hypothetical protein